MTADERRALDAALAALPDRLRLVLELRFLTEPGWTLKQVGECSGVSQQRAGQLQAAALWRLGCRLWLRPAGKPVAHGRSRLESLTDMPALARRLLALRKQTVPRRTRRTAERRPDR
jgi:hypothetical protein